MSTQPPFPASGCNACWATARRRMLYRLWPIVIVTALIATATSSNALASPRRAQASASAFNPRTLAAKRLTALRGGTVRAKNGAELRVPPGVMRRDGLARIREISADVYDFHIYAPWHGQVALVVPGVDDLPFIAHRVLGQWVIEQGRVEGSRTVFTVRHLSLISNLKTCIRAVSKRKILLCLAKLGVRRIPKALAKSFIGAVVDQCGSLDIADLLLDPCTAGEGNYTYTPPPPGGPVQLPPGELQPQPGPQLQPTSPPGPGPAPQPAPQPGPQPAPEPVFAVMNTSETLPDGVWFRNSPHTADTDRVTGHGVYMNEQVRLRCYGWGDAVGAYNNRLWYDVTNVTRPTNNGQPNTGWLNAHYINDGTLASQIDAGVPPC